MIRLVEINIIKVIILIPLYISFSNGQDRIQYPNDNNLYENSACVASDGQAGVCKRNTDCSRNRVRLTRNDICFFSQNVPYYCCVNSVNNNINTKQNNNQPIRAEKLKALRPADESCEMHHPTYEQSFVVGGILSFANEFPHMAAIGWTQANGQVDWKCGGSVITTKFIITAAHCGTFRGTAPDIARTGDLDLLTTENNTFPIDYNITEIITHPQYKRPLLYHDIALMKINPEFHTDVILKPACLYTGDVIPYINLTGMGYGTTAFAGPVSNVLFKGDLLPVPNDICKTALRTGLEIPNGIIDGQMCAQDPMHMKDTCQGDSGGPLQFKTGNTLTNNKHFIVGITSFGEFCAGSAPGVYTRVSYYLDWIESVIWPQGFIKDNINKK